MFFKPKWVKLLPDYIRPTSDQIIKLEEIRERIQESHDVFAMSIAGHPAMTRKYQHYHYNEFKKLNPEWTHHRFLVALITNRWATAIAQGMDLLGLGELPDDEVERRIDEIAKEAKTVDGLADMFIREESSYEIPPLPEFVWAKKEIDRILGEGIDKKK